MEMKSYLSEKQANIITTEIFLIVWKVFGKKWKIKDGGNTCCFYN
jgi:hypothetical protein